MSIEAAEFRRVLGRLATGVAVVAATEPYGGPCGLTASSVASVSLDPPLVLACVDRAADTHDCIHRAGAFTVNFLGANDEALARRFADHPRAEKFDGVAHRTGDTGAPILEGALGWVECRLWASYDGGDHTIFVGLVLAADASAGDPLIYFRGEYARPAS